MAVSEWAGRRFGEAADALQNAVVAGLAEAHGDAVAAQVASGTAKRDPYGHTMENRQHECLVARVRECEVPGAEVVRPRGASFELVRIPATNVVLFLWRYATDSQLRREDTRMRTSRIRRELLTSVADGRGQLTLDHADLQDEDLEAQLAEEEALAAELRSFARVVTIGYASNPTSILDLGWGTPNSLTRTGGWTGSTGSRWSRSCGPDEPRISPADRFFGDAARGARSGNRVAAVRRGTS